MRKKIFVVAICLCLCTVMFSSCSGSVKLSERALVQGIGIDSDGEKIILTLQIFSPSGGNKGELAATSENAKIIRSTGNTLAFAIENASLTQGKEIFLGHARVIVIGEELAKLGLLQTLSYLTSNNFARQNARLIICQGKASDVLSSKTNQGIIPCEMLENLIKNSNQNGFVQDVKLFNFNRSLKNKYESASLPIIQIVEQTTEENKIENVSNIKVNGTAILVDGKMSGSLNQSQTRGLLWIRDEIDKTTIKASDNAYEEAAIQIISTKSKIIPTFQNDKVKMKLIIEADGCLNEAVLREDANVDMSDLSGLEKNCEEIIKAECIDAFNAGVVENNADIFNFGNLTYKYNVSLWKKLHTDWRNNCDEIEFSVVPTVKIKRVGTQFKTKM